MNAITIQFAEALSVPVSIDLWYTVERQDDVQTITCVVKTGEIIPSWLQLRKFQVAARKERAGFVTLYNEKNEDKNLHCTLFIDHAYATIMKKERCNIYAEG